jgi:hypothetical protein
MKAQTGLEYIAVLTLMMALIIPLFFIANQRLEVSRVSGEAKMAMNEIVSSVNAVYAQSPGSRMTAKVYIPDGYDYANSYFANKTIVMKYNLFSGAPYEVMGIVKGNVTGRLPPYPGHHVMTFFLNETGQVIVNTTAT